MSKTKIILGKIEHFGRAFLVPVSILPLVGILLGLGSGLSTTTIKEVLPFLANPAVVFVIGLFQQIGRSVFDNLPMIIAVGLAVGLSKKDKGTAALAAIVGFAAFTYVLSYVLSFRGLLVDADLMAQSGQKFVLGKQVFDINVFGSIIIAMIASHATAFFMDKKLPEVLSFFEGPRMVPFISIIYASAAAIIAAFVWPFVAQGITSLSMFLSSLGAFGSFFYGAIERLLIPFGLHHGLNAMLRFTELGGTAQICGEQYAGWANMFSAGLACDEFVFTADMIKFYSGQFVTKIFGLSGAALAIYTTAKPEKKKEVRGMLIGAVLASVLTGITEPLEFTFLFVAPMLYITHAIITGLAFVTMYLTNTIAISIQGAGLINFILYNVLNSDKTNWQGILIIGPIFFLIYYFLFTFLIRKFDFKTPGRDGADEVRLVSKKEAREKYNLINEDATNKNEMPKLSKETIAISLIEAHGGVANIEEVDACITRLRINVKNKELVDREIITKVLGARGIAEVGNQIQSIYGGMAKTYRSEILRILDWEE
ncbi:MAG: PTS transporter subunit EIIC [Culicoidibacterales bacterium]